MMITSASEHIRGARVHKLHDVDVEMPLNSLVGISGVSGAGQS